MFHHKLLENIIFLYYLRR